MTMKEMTLIEQETENAVNHRIPNLDEDIIQEMGSHEHRQWAHGWMAGHNNGQGYFFNESGVFIQRVTEETVRCTAVVDHPFCYASLAWMRVSFEAAGIKVQVDPYTVVIPYDDIDDETTEPQLVIGMEVA